MKVSVQKLIDSLREPDISITPPPPYSPTLEEKVKLWDGAFSKVVGKRASLYSTVSEGDSAPAKKIA